MTSCSIGISIIINYLKNEEEEGLRQDWMPFNVRYVIFIERNRALDI